MYTVIFTPKTTIRSLAALVTLLGAHSFATASSYHLVAPWTSIQAHWGIVASSAGALGAVPLAQLNLD